MSIVLALSIPGSELSFGSILETVPEVHLQFDQVVPVGTSSFSYVWVNTPERESFEDALQRHSVTESFQFLQREDGELLYRVDWRPETDPFLRCLSVVNAAVLQSRGAANQWHFQIRFDTQDDVSRFQRRCSERDIPITIEQVLSGSAGEHAGPLLTPTQRQTIALALERGYFDVPRRTTVVELANELDVSDQAVSARLRRATKRLSQQALSDAADRNTPRTRVTRP